MRRQSAQSSRQVNQLNDRTKDSSNQPVDSKLSRVFTQPRWPASHLPVGVVGDSRDDRRVPPGDTSPVFPVAVTRRSCHRGSRDREVFHAGYRSAFTIEEGQR
jgi:hypothetical protein